MDRVSASRAALAGYIRNGWKVAFKGEKAQEFCVHAGIPAIDVDHVPNDVTRVVIVTDDPTTRGPEGVRTNLLVYWPDISLISDVSE